MHGLLAVIYGVKARLGAVTFGRASLVLYMSEAAFDAAHRGCGSSSDERACPGGSWGRGDAVSAGYGRGTTRACLSGTAL